MPGIDAVTTQMAGIVPLTAVSGLSVKMSQAMFDNPMTPRRRRRRTATRRRSTARRRSGYNRPRRNAFGGVSPI